MVANKKANGDGSIYKYRDGWRAQLTIGRDENGNIKRKSFTGKTKLEVKKKME